ncbi:MAG: hypothetical protein ACOY6N_08655 [Pseudomonadota bacterium]|jgi:hypothetical protein|uniref:hypothetical protein n=1 Tax=Sulfuricystis thermophila TaxID=2496847 RepID=UPI001035FB7C|nr:hypothetical protein [Sulfuricystis thermophila]MDI6748614.1 hypothetical protein [Rhodocyclaceae bacterium]
MTDPGVASEERRQNPEIRARFLEVYEVLKPFFDPANVWAGHAHEYLAYRALHERFPQMSPQEVQILVEAARRVFSHGRQPAA